MKNAFVYVANSPKHLAWVVVINWVLASELYAIIEHKGPIEGLWWGIVTGSTVGYGDFYPESTAGRGVGAYLIVSCIALVAIATAQLAAKLVLDPEKDEIVDDADDAVVLLCLIADKLGVEIPDSVEEYHQMKGSK